MNRLPCFEVRFDEAREIAEMGVRIIAAADEQIGFVQPENTDRDHFSFCQIAAPVAREDGVPTAANAAVIRPGKIDRSPTETGCSARMAVLHARGELAVGETFVGRMPTSASPATTGANADRWASSGNDPTIVISLRDTQNFDPWTGQPFRFRLHARP